MALVHLLKYCKETAKKYPTLRDEIMELYDLAATECEDEGVSETHECELAMNEIKELVERYEADIAATNAVDSKEADIAAKDLTNE